MQATDLGAYYFHQGTNFEAYKYLGCTLTFEDGGKYVYTFRVWAPNADAVALISDFSGWESPLALSRVTERGVFELSYTSMSSLEGLSYKYRIYRDGREFDKGDPYARFSRGYDDGASVIFTDDGFEWGDKSWLAYRSRTVVEAEGVFLPTPINVYELHIGSFMRHEGDNSYLGYRELAEILPSYVKSMGYTHVEFLPVHEFPYDGSWGYQVCGFYAVSSRFGNPTDFKYLINALHKAGIGVIIDWVPAHFPKDAWGLFEFDGSPLYEYQGEDRKESSWQTRFFDLGREEVQSFLISNALYFLREFHIDGLRVDAVASMLYLDFDRRPGEWVPNSDGTNENREAAAFLRKFNSAVHGEFPDVLTIAEESTAHGGLTSPVYNGGFGFDLKWNMGWANDFYDYVSTDPYFRRYKHKALNFPLMYAFSENYVLPISHDEVVHGKRSFIDKMFGEYEDKFLEARAALLLQMTYPGKKLTFMGTEYAQFREWDFENSLEWFMLDYPKHREFRAYVSALNSFYLSHSELWEIDFDERGFKWIYPDEQDKNLVAFKRLNLRGEEIIVIISFSGASQEISLKVKPDNLEVLFDTGNFATRSDFVLENGLGAKIIMPRFSGVVLKENKKKINIKPKHKEKRNVL
ncbi:MAG: 1,4-alpha-glucan branching protein GlgB [Clostridia bacterium]|nr:1,4-alpha-glucan branching protein GlgB [Clostridia bacterium]